jgi:hypothetical protein
MAVAITMPALAGDVVLLKMGVAAEEGFDLFRGTFATLPAGFSVSKDGSTFMSYGDDDFRGVSPGNVTPGGAYAWTVGRDDQALGYQPTAEEFTPGCFLASVSNATGSEIHSLLVSYEVVFLNNADRSSSLDLEFSLDGKAFARIPDASFTTPAQRESTSFWRSSLRSVTIVFRPHLLPGSRVWLRWQGDDVGGSGSRDEYGINRLRITPREPEGTVLSIR